MSSNGVWRFFLHSALTPPPNAPPTISPIVAQTTTFTWPSTYVTEFPITVVRLNLSGNRMRRKSGYRLADMLLLNKTVTDLDASNNSLDSQVGLQLWVTDCWRNNSVLPRSLMISMDTSGLVRKPRAWCLGAFTATLHALEYGIPTKRHGKECRLP